MGGRGATSQLWEMIISLVLIAAMAWVFFAFVLANTNGDKFLSRFWASDIASTAQVVAAGNGDVVLRYDNLKPNPLTFELRNGFVGIGPGQTMAASPYGRAAKYSGPSSLTGPTFLAIRKLSGTLSIDSTESLRGSCPAVEHQVPLADATVEVRGSTEVRDAMRAALADTRIRVVDTEGTIILSFTRGPAGQNSVVFGAGDAEVRSYACEFLRQLAAISVAAFDAQEPRPGGSGFSVDITLSTTSDVTLTDEQIGKALAYALAVHYR